MLSRAATLSLIQLGIGFIGAAACGARTDPADIRSVVGSSGSGDDREGGARGTPDGGRCEHLTAIGGPVVVLDAIGASYEDATAVARLGGLDVVAFRVGATDPTAYVARRVRVTGGVVTVEGAEVVVGPNARALGAAATDGASMALCWPDPDLFAPTRFALYAGTDYRPATMATVGAGAGDFCTNLFPFHGHWWAAWSDRSTPAADTVFAELGSDGAILSPKVAVTGLHAAAPHGDGFAIVQRARPAQMTVRFWSPASAAEVAVPTGQAVADSAWLVSSPFASNAIELGWYAPSGAAAVVRVFEDGTSAATTPIDVGPNFRGGPIVAAFAGEIAVALGRRAASGGEIVVSVRDAAGALRGQAIIPTGAPVVPRLVAIGSTLLVVWSEPSPTGVGTVRIQPLGC